MQVSRKASSSKASSIKASSRKATSSKATSSMVSRNVEGRGFSYKGLGKKALIALILIWCSLHLPVVTGEGENQPEFSHSDNIEGSSEDKNHVLFNAAMHVVLFVLTKNFHIGAFLITVLPLISLVKMSIDKHRSKAC